MSGWVVEEVVVETRVLLRKMMMIPRNGPNDAGMTGRCGPLIWVDQALLRRVPTNAVHHFACLSDGGLARGEPCSGYADVSRDNWAGSVQISHRGAACIPLVN